MEINQLINECKKANPKAQRMLLERYSGRLFSVALRYAVDRPDAKDILQEAWINIFNGIIKYTHQNKLEGWMTRIVINVALRKKRNTKMEYSSTHEEFYGEVADDTLAIDQLQYDDLLRMVNQLPDVCREVFKLAAIDGIKHKEIGEILGITDATSRSHLTRAKKKLRELIVKMEKAESYGR